MASYSRRDLLRFFSGGLLTAAIPPRLRTAASQAATPSFERPVLVPLTSIFDRPVLISRIDLVELDSATAKAERWLRVHLDDGTIGAIPANDQLRLLLPLLRELVIPYFTGKDARGVEQLIDGVYEAERNYKFAGMPFWNCVGHVELAVLDALGRRAARPVHALFAPGPRRTTIPMYVTRLTRETSPQREAALVSEALARTGARAVKIKVGGRMRRNVDAAPGRTEQLIPLIRRTVGEAVTIYADANGSYDAAEGIRIGRLLEEHAVAIYEEPCPWQDVDATRAVARALRTVQVAGGEQDTSLHSFDMLIRTRTLDIVQPDLFYNGGLIRAMRVARMAREAGRLVGPHTPKSLPASAPLLHFAASCPNITPFMEYRAEAPEFRNGMVQVPVGPGYGHERGQDFWRAAVPL